MFQERVKEWLEEFKWEIELLRVPKRCKMCELLGICRSKESNWKCLNGCMIMNAERAYKYEGLPNGCWDCKYLKKCRAPKEEGWKCQGGCRQIKKKRNEFLFTTVILIVLYVLFQYANWQFEERMCVCSALTYETERYVLDDRVRAICNCNTSGTFQLVQITCEHDVRIQLQVFPDEGYYMGKCLRTAE